MTSDIQISTRGDVGEKAKRHAVEKVAHALRFHRDDVLFARVKLLLEPDPARERPALAAAECQIDGMMVRAHAIGVDLHEAIDALADRLRSELEHLAERRQHHRRRGPRSLGEREWRHGDASTPPPPFFDRPVEERQVVRRTTYALHPLSLDEAVDEMEVLAHDFHLFVHRDTGHACVLGRQADGRLELRSLGPLPPTPDWLVTRPEPSLTMDVEEARRRLDATGDPYVVFRDAQSGEAAVLYHRYDGHYGLLRANGRVVGQEPEVVVGAAIRGYLAERGVAAELLPHAPVHTAWSEAVRLGVPAHEVAKTLVLDTREGHALAVIPASERLDMGLVHRAAGDGQACLASEDELLRDYPGYELGAFPPVGSLLQARVYVDPAVMHHDTIVFAAGRADLSLRARTDELFRTEDTVIAPLIRELDEKEKELLDHASSQS